MRTIIDGFRTTLQSASIRLAKNNNRETSIFIPKNIGNRLNLKSGSDFTFKISKKNIINSIEEAQQFLKNANLIDSYDNFSDDLNVVEKYFADQLIADYTVMVSFNQGRWYFKNLRANGFNIRDYLIEKISTILFEEEANKIYMTIENESYNLEDIEQDFEYGDNSAKTIKARLEKLYKTDKEIVTTQRIEQSILRDWLFKDNLILPCSICNKQFHKKLLVSAHIKQRSKATEEERMDVNIVARMCRLGCDELYEHGCISVQNGIIVSIKKGIITPPVSAYIKSIEGKKCLVFNSKNKKYFDWHFNRSISNV